MTDYAETLRCLHNLVAELGWKITGVEDTYLQFQALTPNKTLCEIRLAWHHDKWVFVWYDVRREDYWEIPECSDDGIDFWTSGDGMAFVFYTDSGNLIELHFGDYKDEE